GRVGRRSARSCAWLCAAARIPAAPALHRFAIGVQLHAAVGQLRAAARISRRRRPVRLVLIRSGPPGRRRRDFCVRRHTFFRAPPHMSPLPCVRRHTPPACDGTPGRAEPRAPAHLPRVPPHTPSRLRPCGHPVPPRTCVPGRSAPNLTATREEKTS